MFAAIHHGHFQRIMCELQSAANPILNLGNRRWHSDGHACGYFSLSGRVRKDMSFRWKYLNTTARNMIMTLCASLLMPSGVFAQTPTPTVVTAQLCNAGTSPCFAASFQFCPPAPPQYATYSYFAVGSASGQFAADIPSYAKITHIRISLPMTSGFTGRYANVSVKLNDTPIGVAQRITAPPMPCGSVFPTYVFEQDFPSGLTGYSRSNLNSVKVTVESDSTTGMQFEYFAATVEITYVPGVDIRLLDGDNQTGSTGGPAKSPLKVQLITGPGGAPLEGKQVTFSITEQPSKAIATVGGSENGTSSSYTAAVGADGLAEATFVAGVQPGTYTITAACNDTVEPKLIKFTETAEQPDLVRIFKNVSPTQSVSQGNFIVSPVEVPRFLAYGLRRQNSTLYTPIGPVRATWSFPSTARKGATATLSPSGAVSSVTFTPMRVGTAQLSITPAISVKSENAEITISGVLVDASGTFATTHQDESALFLPGSIVSSGQTYNVPSPGAPIQTISLHLLTPPGTSGNVKYSLSKVTSYPGIAMNYPVDNPDTGPDMAFETGSDAARQATPEIPFDPSGDTATRLQVFDYAAYGHLKATLTFGSGNKVKTFEVEKDLPEIADNALPKAGWDALADRATGRLDHVPNTGQAATSDADALPATGPVTLNGQTDTIGITGDGLSAYEEYRGFVVGGEHRRLNPARKDVFVDMDPSLRGLDQIFFKLPLTFHYVDSDEVARDSDGLHPLADPNGWGTPGGPTPVPGWSAQYALRVRARQVSPVLTDNTRIPALIVPAYVEYYGKHFYLGENLNQVVNPDQNPNGSPNETLVVDIFTESFGKSAIFPDATGVLHSVIVCNNPLQQGCDVLDTTFNAIFPGNDGVLDTPMDPADHKSEMLRDCLGRETFYPASMLGDLKEVVVAHEGAHGLNVNHTDFFPAYFPNNDPCGSLMYSHGNILPFPTDYLPLDILQLRLHRKHP